MMFSKLDFNAETGEAVKEPETKEEPEEEEAGPGPDPEATAAADPPSTNDHNNNTAAPDKLASAASDIGEINSFRIPLKEVLSFGLIPHQSSTIKYYPPFVIIFSMIGEKVYRDGLKSRPCRKFSQPRDHFLAYLCKFVPKP